MSGATSYKIAVSTFVVWCLFNLATYFGGAVGSPWHESSVYVGGGLVFAALTAGFAWFARRQGKETLSPRTRAFTGCMILASLCFVLVLLMAFAGLA